jgi:hypothetical protein
MNKAAELAARLNHVDITSGMKLIEDSCKSALHFDVVNDVMCVMHSDGSVNIVQGMGKGAVTVEVISSENILKVLEHYRPFRDVFKGKMQ